MPSFSRRKQYSLHPDRTSTFGSSGSATLPNISSRSSKQKLSRRRFGTSKVRSSTRRKLHTLKHDQKQPLIAKESMVLHELVPSVPMPGERELETLFAQIVVSVMPSRIPLGQIRPISSQCNTYLHICHILSS